MIPTPLSVARGGARPYSRWLHQCLLMCISVMGCFFLTWRQNDRLGARRSCSEHFRQHRIKPRGWENWEGRIFYLMESASVCCTRRGRVR
ncbi:hypothetical protein M406DRAFT_357707 [Cryphonectria parasitica EP155]|uniref:Uncharacterized protein n=1 Tax=Cryphonectria parasitica (strain ATCC 38755 / EP155) TaxID=660469 RepID=A0A9P4XV25_CRYP1|nr:uncharacterized protein M406DRAFT_357707 [Cryphonectria parasitica EP155]KAF3761367.1 hypothetical protein M406DRAFT_357707 [Cryphonectria parasitica EP155]